MSLTRLQHRRWRSLLLLPLLFALVFRAFIPAGYMPIVANDGHFTMALCSDGLNAKLTLMPAQAGEPSPHEHDGDAPNGPCVYAASAHSVVGLSVGPWLPEFAPEFTAVINPARGLAAPGVIPRAQSPRGPPTLS